MLRVTGWGDLAALVTVLAFAGAAGAWLWSTFLADDPWQDRADRICLSRDGEWPDATGPPAQRLRERIDISHMAADDLQALRSDVPISETLSYGTMLSDKREFIALLKRKLALIEAGKPTTRVDDRLRSASDAHSVDAENLGLHV